MTAALSAAFAPARVLTFIPGRRGSKWPCQVLQRSAPSNVGAPLLKGEQRLFETQTFAAHELPDGIVGDGYPAGGQFVPQMVPRQVRGLLDPLGDEGMMRLKHPPTMAADLARRHAAGRPIALRPLHHRGNRDIKPLRHDPAALRSCNRSYNTLTKAFE